MKIKTISLYNVGPYIDKNTFELSSDKDRSIVLIGGRNGAGKTSFFKAIKTCLYGCKVWGFDAPGKDYYSIVDSLINTRMQYDNVVKAYIEIELEFDDGKQVTNYILHREWLKTKKQISETFSITKDARQLDEDELLDFNNYLLSIIPPDMFNFYFFDGESIVDFFLGNNGGKNFRNAFLKLYGLDTLSIMVENFERNFKKKEGKNAVYEEYINSRKELDKKRETLDSTIQRIKDLEDKIDLTQISIQSLQKDYTKEGGISLSKWKEINTDLVKEETRRDELNRWLKEVANHYLPFIILSKEMTELLTALEKEQNVQKYEILKDSLLANSFKEAFDSFVKNKYGDKVESDSILSFIVDSVTNDKTSGVKFDYSMPQINRIISQIYEKNGFDQDSIKKAIQELSKSLNRSKQLRDELASSSIDGYEEFAQKKDELDSKINELTIQLEKQRQEKGIQEIEVAKAESDFTKAKDNYEKMLKSKSINELSARAVQAYSTLTERLILRQGRILQNEFINCFSKIINKVNFLDGIVVDRNINLIPYKMVEVSFLQIDNYLSKKGQNEFLELFDNKYLYEINQLRLGYKETIKLPAPIHAPFSQGERQVYIMSIYLALLKTSRKDIPFFIDTPFARIDSSHRERIIREFFLGVQNQMFILSTDEEIVGHYKDLLNSRISDKFVLSISNYGMTEIKKGKYFGE